MKHIITVLLVAALSVAAIGSDGKTEQGSAPLNVMFSKYEDYLEIAADGPPGFSPIYQVVSDGKGMEGVVFTFSHGGEDFRVMSGQQGYIDFRPTQGLLQANPMVTVNQPKGTMGMSLRVQLDVPLEKEYDIQALFKQTQVAWKKVKKLGGFMSFLAPKYTNLLIEFEDSCTERNWTVYEDGKATHETGDVVLVPFKKKKARKAERLTLSCRPKRILFQ